MSKTYFWKSYFKGASFDNSPSIEEALDLAGLNWKIKYVPLIWECGVCSEDGSYLYDDVPKRRGIVREDTNEMLGTVGKIFTTVNNVNAFRFLHSFVEEGTLEIQYAGYFGEGQKVWVLAKVPQSVLVTDNDTINNYFLITNAHDGTQSFTVRLTPIREKNGTIVELGTAAMEWRLRHTRSLPDRMADLHTILSSLPVVIDTQKHIIQELLKIKISKSKALELLEELFPIPLLSKRPLTIKNKRDTIYSLFCSDNEEYAVQGTAWAFYCAVIEYIDTGRSKKLENNLKNALTGTKKELKFDILEKIMTFAAQQQLVR